MTKQTLSNLLLAVAIVLMALALVTLLPSQGKKSDLGYSSLCPFAPWSTLALLVPAGIAWAIRSYVKSQPSR